MLKTKSIIEQDLVLIYADEQPAFYARVEDITADVKPNWWRVKLLFLTMPAQMTTWIIDDEQIRGAGFTMGGTPIRIEKLEMPEELTEFTNNENATDTKDHTETKGKKARVLSLGAKKGAKS